MYACLLMHGDELGLFGHEILKVPVRLFDHQMHVKGQIRLAHKALHHRGPEAYVRNEVSVHHIHMDQMGSA